MGWAHEEQGSDLQFTEHPFRYIQGKGITVNYLQCNSASKQGGKFAELCHAHAITMDTAPNAATEWSCGKEDCNGP